MPGLLAQSDTFMYPRPYPMERLFPYSKQWQRVPFRLLQKSLQTLNGSGTERTGFLVPVEEKGVLAERIVSAIRSRTLLKRSRDENLAIIEEKALWPVIIERTKEIYDRILNSKVENGVA